MEFPHDSGVQITYLPRRGMGVLGKPEPGSATGPTAQEDWENAPGRKPSTPSLQRKTKTLRSGSMNKNAGLIGLVTSRFEIDDATLEKWASFLPGGSPLKRVPIPAAKAPAKVPAKLKPPKGSAAARSSAKAPAGTPEPVPPTGGAPAPGAGAPMPAPPAPVTPPSGGVAPPPATAPAGGPITPPAGGVPDLEPMSRRSGRARGRGLNQGGMTPNQVKDMMEVGQAGPRELQTMWENQGNVVPWHRKLLANPGAQFAGQMVLPMLADPFLRRAFGDESMVPQLAEMGMMFGAGGAMNRLSGAEAFRQPLTQRAIRGQLRPAPAPAATA